MNQSLRVLAAAITAAALPDAAFADLASNVGVVSDYRYRGISQSRLEPALQGGADYDNGGLYVGAWASTIKWITDAGTAGSFGAGNADVELDIYGGYKAELVKDSLAYDIGLLAYQYPGNKLTPRAETYEIYGALTYGPVTAKYSHSVGRLFGVAHSRNSGYLDLGASFELASGLSLAAHIGRQSISHNGGLSYSDCSLALTYQPAKGLVLGATAYATDTKKIGGTYAYSSPAGKDLGRTGIAAGVKYMF